MAEETKNTNSELSKRGEELIARARQNRVTSQQPPKFYKPNKLGRHIWTLMEYTQALMTIEGLGEEEAKRILRLVFTILQKALLRGDVVTLPGIGRLYVLYMPPRNSQNHLVIPDAARLVFRTSTAIKRLIKPHAQYFTRFNDHPAAGCREEPLVEPKPVDLEAFVVAQGWEDETGAAIL